MAITDGFSEQLSSIGGGFLNSAYTLVLIIIFGIILVGFVMLIMYLLRYPIRVDVETRYGNNVVEYTTRGGIIKDRKSGVKKFVVWRTNTNPFQPWEGALPSHKDMRQSVKGKRRVRIFKDTEDGFKIIPPLDEEVMKEKPIDMDWLSWGSMTLMGKAERYRKDPNFMEKYGTLLGFGMVAVVMIFIVIFGFQENTKTTEQIAKIAEANAETAKSMERVNFGLSGKQIIEGQTPENVGDGT